MTTDAAALPVFHDAHAHVVEHQRGGFLIALEGEPVLSYMLSNHQVLAMEDRARLLLAVPYVRHDDHDSAGAHPVVKFHARREGYTPDWVAENLGRHPRRIALVDTLNSADWEPRSYLDLAKQFPGTQFLFCHAGGYDILEFLKIARFVPNAWIDVSATQEIFGWIDGASTLPTITDAIGHAFAEPRIARKLMFGSDNPGFRQADAVAAAVRHLPDPTAYLTGNFEHLLETAGLR